MRKQVQHQYGLLAGAQGPAVTSGQASAVIPTIVASAPLTMRLLDSDVVEDSSFGRVEGCTLDPTPAGTSMTGRWAWAAVSGLVPPLPSTRSGRVGS